MAKTESERFEVTALSKGRTVLAVVIGVPAIMLAADAFCAAQYDDYDADRFGTANVESVSDYANGRWWLNGVPLTDVGECPVEDSCDDPMGVGR